MHLLAFFCILLSFSIFPKLCFSAADYEDITISEEIMQKAAKFAVVKINSYIRELPDISSDITLKLDKVLSHQARRSIDTIMKLVTHTKEVTLYNPITELPVVFEAETYTKQGSSEFLDVSIDISMHLFRTTSLGNSRLYVNVTVSKDNDDFQALTKYTAFDALAEVGESDEYNWMFPDRYFTSKQIGLIPEQQENERYLSILNANIWNYNHWQKRISVLADEIKRLNPDVVGFQEVRARKWSDRNESRYQIEDLVKSVPGYQFIYNPAMGWQESDEEYVHEGVAIFSKFPVLSTNVLKLSNDPTNSGDFHKRILLTALLDTPIGRVNFMTTHLSLDHEAQKRTLGEIAEYADSLPDPCILVGDFNAILKESKSHSWAKDHGWLDAWELLYEDDETGWSFNSWDPKSRIDYVFLKGLRVNSITLEGQVGKPFETYLEPVGGVRNMKNTMFPSDHRFLFAHLVRD